jgi:hypothetical protein
MLRVITLIVVLLAIMGCSVPPAQNPPVAQPPGAAAQPPAAVAQPSSAPFRFVSTPVPWEAVTIINWYGNTNYAYTNRDRFYRQTQGYHSGLDFVVPLDTPITNTTTRVGTVLSIDNQKPDDFGAGPCNVLVDYQEYVVLYGHTSCDTKKKPKPGAIINPGDQITLSGTDGRTPHLHMELIQKDPSWDQLSPDIKSITRPGNIRLNPVPVLAPNLVTQMTGKAWDTFHRISNTDSRYLTPEDQPSITPCGPYIDPPVVTDPCVVLALAAGDGDVELLPTGVPENPVAPVAVLSTPTTVPQTLVSPTDLAMGSALQMWLGTVTAKGLKGGRGGADAPYTSDFSVTHWPAVAGHPAYPIDFLRNTIPADNSSIQLSYQRIVSPAFQKPAAYVGNAEIKNIQAAVTQQDQLSGADTANSITWRGEVTISFIVRFRENYSRLRIPPPPSPDSTWSDWRDETRIVQVQHRADGWLVASRPWGNTGYWVEPVDVPDRGPWTTHYWNYTCTECSFPPSPGTWTP